MEPRTATDPRSARRVVARLAARLLEAYGPQGWWPLRGHAGEAGFDEHGYHPGDYQVPAHATDRFEIAAGAILTQNTAWTNVEPALDALRAGGLLEAGALAAASERDIAGRVRPSGAFNQKARKLRLLAAFLAGRSSPPAREELLGVWGIGPETADSILLYAYHQPAFVVDAYTRRLLRRLGAADGRESYAGIQALFAEALPREERVYNELHALIVRHAKEHCRSVPSCGGCPLARGCPSRVGSLVDASRRGPIDSAGER